MPKNIFSIWKIALFIGLLVFASLLWLNDHVGYTAKSAILINGYNDNQDHTLAKTIAAFSGTDVFVQRTLGSTRLQESLSEQLSAEEQKKAVETVDVLGGKKGGLVVIVATHADAEVAEIISRESTETLLRMSRFYIGDEKEFKSVVIDEAIVRKGLIWPEVYIAKSFFTALALFVVLLVLEPGINWFSQRMQKFTGKKNVLARESEHPEEFQETLDQRFVPQKLDPAFLYTGSEGHPEAPTRLPKASEILKEEVYGALPETAAKTPLQSVSVSMEDLPFTFETPVKSTEPAGVDPGEAEEISKPAAAESIPADKEPSVLEYKRRLNELLSQK